MLTSPCRRDCCLDQHECCVGCGRTLQEITKWHQADLAQKLQIVQNAKQRLLQRKADQASLDNPF